MRTLENAVGPVQMTDCRPRRRLAPGTGRMRLPLRAPMHRPSATRRRRFSAHSSTASFSRLLSRPTSNRRGRSTALVKTNHFYVSSSAFSRGRSCVTGGFAYRFKRFFNRWRRIAHFSFNQDLEPLNQAIPQRNIKEAFINRPNLS